MAHIRLEGVGKAFKHYPTKSGRLKEWLGLPSVHHQKWVLRDISFSVAPGESVGIIGVNGAGKSTLLKIIAGTTHRTTGALDIAGRVSALLELGMGFHPEFTGRENVFMSGQVGGLSAAEVASVMPDIEDFAGIGSSIDEPVRTYSSGMHVRLAFAVATAVRPEILIVDEALAVGDIFFQQKCFERIRQFRDQGTTILFVTHSMAVIYSLCDRAILLEDSRIKFDGEPKAAIDVYNSTLERHLAPHLPAPGSLPTKVEASPPVPALDVAREQGLRDDFGGGPYAGSFAHAGVAIEDVALLVDGQRALVVVSEAQVAINVRVRFDDAFRDPHVGFQIRDRIGSPIFMTNTFCMGHSLGPVAKGTVVTLDFQMQLPLAEGEYTITVGVANEGAGQGSFRESLARWHGAVAFTVARNQLSIVWAGYCNLSPRVAIRRS